MTLRTLLSGVILLLFYPCIAFANPQPIAELKHTIWTADNGAPTNLNVMVQAPGSYLWLGSSAGLVRFDGVRFEVIPGPAGSTTGVHGVIRLLADRDGSVWVGYDSGGGVAVYRHGKLEDTRMPSPPQQIISLARDKTGAIWAATSGRFGSLRRYWHGRWTSVGPGWASPTAQITKVFASQDGSLWVAYSDRLAVLRPGAKGFVTVPTAVAWPSLAQDVAGTIWVADETGLRKMQFSASGQPTLGALVCALDPVRDRDLSHFSIIAGDDGSIWARSRRSGLLRFRTALPIKGQKCLERFDRRDGLMSDRMLTMAEGGQNALWVGSDMGVERFRSARVRIEPAITPRDPGGYMATSGLGGTIRIVDSDRVYAIVPGQAPTPVLPVSKHYTNLCAAADGGYWLLIGQALLRHSGGRGDYSIATPPGTTTYLCAEDDQGRLWLNNFSRDNYWHDASGWHLMRGPAALEELIRLPSGKVVGQFGTGSIMLLGGLLPRPITAAEIGVGNIGTVSPGLTDTFISGSAGLARWRGNHFKALRSDLYPWLAQARGLVQTRHGDTWLLSPRGVIRVASRDLNAAFDRPGIALAHDLFDQRDGLTSAPQHFGMAGPQVVRGGDDRVWFLTEGGIIQLAPAALTRDAVAPTAKISALTAVGEHRLDPTNVDLPKGTTRLEFEFTALGLSDPERAVFRYRLDGLDSEWSEGNQRQATYTNLGPGQYRFRVAAANRDGLWSKSEAGVNVVIAPKFIQTPLFSGLLGAIFLLFLWLLYRLRVRQVAIGIGQRLEARLSERERIARELHDTLLQGVQGLVMRFQSAARRIEPGSSARAEMESALDRADDVLAQGRDKVLALRASGVPVDAPVMLAQLIARQPFTDATKVALHVDGELDPLQPIIADEIAAIVGEALFNAARHANARSVEVLAKTGLDGFTVIIRDDGVGVSQASLNPEPTDGHFGLIGMRERAGKIGAELTIGSGPKTGTEVVLIVPTRTIFQPPEPDGLWTWLDRLAGHRWRPS